MPRRNNQRRQILDAAVAEGTDAFVEKLRREVVYHIDVEIEKCKMLHSVKIVETLSAE